MYIIMFLWLLIIVLLFILFKLINISKNYFMSVLISLSILFFLFNINECINAALVGLNLVIKSILPTIFPFSVICNLLISYDGISLYSKVLGPLICKPLKLSKSSSFPIAASIISGYPLGAKYACELYSKNFIDKEEFERLLFIASNASPMFLIGAIGATMLGNPYYGYILLIANYISPIIVGFLTISRKKKSYITTPSSSQAVENTNFGTSLKLAIENGINTTLAVGAFVIIFSIIISIIKNNAYISIVFSYVEKILTIPPNSLYGLFIGSIEFTNGCKLISSSSLSLTLKLSIISFICSFSGVSVIAQVSSIISKYSVNIKKYTFYKLITGIVSFIITLTTSNLLINTSIVSTIHTPLVYNSNKLLIPMYIFLVVSLLIAIITRRLKKLHIS